MNSVPTRRQRKNAFSIRHHSSQPLRLPPGKQQRPHPKGIPMRPILTLSLSAALLLSALTPMLAGAAAPVSVGPQYDTTHVYVAPNDVDAFVRSFTATFGGQSTRQVIATVTPTPSSTSSQLVQTPAGTVSLFGFRTPVPHPFGNERTGYLVTDIQQAVSAARAAGAEVLVAPFKDPIGMDAVIAWPGGVAMQLYWHDRAALRAAGHHPGEPRICLTGSRRCVCESMVAVLAWQGAAR
ncbi:hypothetical protein [Xanthomonas campestris]|uniref:hypothetical protein n=2 Tax=Xanthomonas campestris TaxID=339 RepID=UPI001ED8E253